ncbi:hypothetical protein SLEP1_g18010 [Rubroshorea leprosula]|uniref:Verticillium wilt resistance-like protein n=1 Tax=Rubroshorea leprosula TaxID=152421 RepID=A0AAV5J1M4_9ROSI|nr:hypothetical protein SLEP1_g18010 [Rubroshorea leprosula]
MEISFQPYLILIAFSLWLHLNAGSVRSLCLEDQQSSLLKFKQTLIFDPALSSKLVSWDSSANCCSWPGVTFSGSGHVIGLDLSNESISSGIDSSSSLFDLHHLQSLNLALNRFNGTRIPSGLDKLANLRHLKLSYSEFNGQIPTEISGLTRLVFLDISVSRDPHSFYFYSHAELKLENPNLSMLVRNLTRLREFHLQGTNISAEGPERCRALSSLPRLRVLNLADCLLSGPIDSSLAKMKLLSVIQLSFNQLSAPVPEFVGNFLNLASLHLKGCDLHGKFPAKVFQLLTLQSLDISSNPLLQGFLPEFPENGSLQILVLESTNFSGMIPSSVGNLKMLSTLQLSSCNFSTSIPNSIGSLANLIHLDLSYNWFSGAIPSFSMLKNLVDLDLSHNNLSGPISSTHWANLSNLVNLQLYDNSLKGVIPSSLFSLPSFQRIDLSNNRFSGQIGDFPIVSSSQLVALDLSNNKLNGSIPSYFFKLQGLKQLILPSNSFNGTLELSIIQKLGNLSALVLSFNDLLVDDGFVTRDISNILQQTQFIDYSENQFNSVIPTDIGRIPKSLANCKMLEVLDVGNNGINDSFPCWLSTISSLRVLVLRSNKFYGSIECPDVVIVTNKGIKIELAKILTIFTSIDFSCNNFEGKIPGVIGEFRGLYFLNLSHNFLAGPIPSSLGNLQYLESLDLSTNNLSGEIPQQLGCLNFLEVLNLSLNQLKGRIPKANQLQTFSEDSFKDNKGLCGTPLMDCGANMQPQSEGKNSDNGAKIDWNLISAEVGFVFGLAIVILPLLFWKRWRIWALKAHRRRNQRSADENGAYCCLDIVVPEIRYANI